MADYPTTHLRIGLVGNTGGDQGLGLCVRASPVILRRASMSGELAAFEGGRASHVRTYHPDLFFMGQTTGLSVGICSGHSAALARSFEAMRLSDLICFGGVPS